MAKKSCGFESHHRHHFILSLFLYLSFFQKPESLFYLQAMLSIGYRTLWAVCFPPQVDGIYAFV